MSRNRTQCRDADLPTENQWCRRRDLNPHGPYSPLDPESSASANSATSASWSTQLKKATSYFIFFCYKVKYFVRSDSNHSDKDEKMTGGRTSAVFGETLWRHLYLSHCRNETPWKRSCTSASPVTHSSKDPPCRGAEKTTLAGSPPVTAYKRHPFEDC